MKKLAIIAGIVVLIIVIAFAVLAASANSIAAKYRPDIEKAASSALGTQVRIGDLAVSVFPSVKIHLQNFALGDGVSLNGLALKVGLFPLLGGNIEVTELLLDEPNLKLIQTNSGYQVEGLPASSPEQSSPAKEKAPANPTTSSALSQDAPTTNAPIKLDLRRFSLSAGNFEIRQLDGKVFTFAPINLDASLSASPSGADLSTLVLTGALNNKVEFGARAASAKLDLQNTLISIPEAEFELLGNKTKLSVDLNYRTTTGKINLGGTGFELKSLTPLLNVFSPNAAKLTPIGQAIPKMDIALAGSNSISLDGGMALKEIGLQLGDLAISQLSGEIIVKGYPNNLAVRSKDLKLALNGSPIEIATSLNLVDKTIDLRKLAVDGFGGRTNLSLTLDSATGDLTSEGDISAIRLEQLLVAVKKEAIPLEGGVKLIKYSIKGQTGEQLTKSLLGTASIDLADAKLKGINIAGEVLKAVKDLPFMSTSLISAVPDGPSKKALESPDTKIDQLAGSFNIGDGGLATNDLTMKSALFDLRANGRINFDQNINLQATILFSKDLSTAMTTKVKEISRIVNSDGRLEIPLVIQGHASSIKVIPNIQRLLEIAATQALKSEGKKALDKFLGGSSKSGKKGGIGGILGF